MALQLSRHVVSDRSAAVLIDEIACAAGALLPHLRPPPASSGATGSYTARSLGLARAWSGFGSQLALHEVASSLCAPPMEEIGCAARLPANPSPGSAGPHAGAHGWAGRKNQSVFNRFFSYISFVFNLQICIIIIIILLVIVVVVKRNLISLRAD